LLACGVHSGKIIYTSVDFCVTDVDIETRVRLVVALFVAAAETGTAIFFDPLACVRIGAFMAGKTVPT
jgi:hypothetical protein